jgi:hypothetical protein
VRPYGGLADQKLTTQFEFIRLVTISFNTKRYRRLRCLTVCASGAVGEGSHVLVIARLQTIGGSRFSGGERVSKGRHVGYGCVCYRLKFMWQTQLQDYTC